MGYHKLSELKVWQKSRVFRKNIYDLSRTFSSEEKYKLVDQIVRSSRSITANISEGHGRFHYQENIQFCRIARGSLVETFDHLTVSLDCEYIDKSKFEELEKEINEIEKMLNGYINYLMAKNKSEK